MKKTLLIVLTLGILTIWACTDDEAQDENENQISTEEQNAEKEEDKTDYLSIEGKDIWVRNQPSTGDVVMKLNSGDKCKILEKGKQETINKQTDFWYKIEFEGETGWVFGSQTSEKTGITAQNPKADSGQKALKQVNQLISDIHKSYPNISQYFYDSRGILFLNNPGVYDVVEYTSDLSIMEMLLKEKSTCKLKFQKWPEFSFEKSQWEKSGCFAEQVNGTNIFHETAKVMREYSLPVTDMIIDETKKLGTQVRIKVLNTKNNIRYYFGTKNGEWKLIGIDISDFSS
jgi:hypothetical protein